MIILHANRAPYPCCPILPSSQTASPASFSVRRRRRGVISGIGASASFSSYTELERRRDREEIMPAAGRISWNPDPNPVPVELRNQQSLSGGRGGGSRDAPPNLVKSKNGPTNEDASVERTIDGPGRPAAQTLHRLVGLTPPYSGRGAPSTTCPSFQRLSRSQATPTGMVKVTLVPLPVSGTGLSTHISP